MRGPRARAVRPGDESRLRAMGCGKINLQVRTSNDAVIGFYKRLGTFVIDDIQPSLDPMADSIPMHPQGSGGFVDRVAA
jgi:hypothetical protein